MWVCRYCGKRYRWDTSLMRHLKAKHLEEMRRALELAVTPGQRRLLKAVKGC